MLLKIYKNDCVFDLYNYVYPILRLKKVFKQYVQMKKLRNASKNVRKKFKKKKAHL